MRVVKLDEFLTLPNGTLYERVSEHHVPEGHLIIKGDTCSLEFRDWYTLHIGGVDGLDLEGYPDSLDVWEQLNKNPDLRTTYDTSLWGREGTYPTMKDNIRFLIYEEDDLVQLVQLLVHSWFFTKYPKSQFHWTMDGYAPLIANTLTTAENERVTVIYQHLTHDGWLDCDRATYDREYSDEPTCTRIVSLVAEGSHDLDLSVFSE